MASTPVNPTNRRESPSTVGVEQIPNAAPLLSKDRNKISPIRVPCLFVEAKQRGFCGRAAVPMKTFPRLTTGLPRLLLPFREPFDVFRSGQVDSPRFCFHPANTSRQPFLSEAILRDGLSTHDDQSAATRRLPHGQKEERSSSGISRFPVANA